MQTHKPKLIIFASGSKDGGGSGFENLVLATHEHRGSTSVLDVEIVAVVSNHKNGGVRKRADKLKIPFIHFSGPYTAEGYKSVVARALNSYNTETHDSSDTQSSQDCWVALSGWLKIVKGLDPAKTFNIHPALLSQLGGKFGGRGLWGRHVHEAVKDALEKGEITESGLTMHFVTGEYDRGPIFFEHKVPLTKDMSAKEIGEAVNKAEHRWQPVITNKVISGEIAYADFVE